MLNVSPQSIRIGGIELSGNGGRPGVLQLSLHLATLLSGHHFAGIPIT
jgi:hypothetical protein